ncbi:hypothetical protein Hanom_Chr00s207002g01839581 [Helianthus anomalus]
MDYHVLNSTKRKKSLFINFLPNTQNRFIAISKHNNQIIRLKTQSQTPSISTFTKWGNSARQLPDTSLFD